jgi:hypothetical protein
MHLNDEQLEEALAGAAVHAEHLSACADCRRRLQAQQEMRGRLQRAFSSAAAPADLAARVRGGMATLSVAMQRTRRSGPPTRRVIRWMPALAAAAAALIVAVPLIVVSLSTSDVQAAASQLAEIHQANLAQMNNPSQFYAQDDPAKLAAYFKDKLHFTPAMPKLEQGLEMRGCCKSHFDKGIVGSYVVQTPSGYTSIVVVREAPERLGLKDKTQQGGRTYFHGVSGCCTLVAVRLGEYTYCAVAMSDLGTDKLVDLLGRLVN